MLILKTKLQEKGISKLQKLSLCKHTNTLNGCIEFCRYREFRICHKGHFHLSGVKTESCAGTRMRKKWKKTRKKRNSQLSMWLPTHAAHTRSSPEQWGSLSALLWMYKESLNPNTPPSRSLHLYETSATWYHGQMGHPGWGCCLGAFKVELLTSQGLHLIHMESGSFHILQWEDTMVLRGQRLCRSLELEQDGHGVQGLHLQKPTARTMGGIKHKPQKTRWKSHFSGGYQPKVPRKWTSHPTAKSSQESEVTSPAKVPFPMLPTMRVDKSPPRPRWYPADK